MHNCGHHHWLQYACVCIIAHLRVFDVAAFRHVVQEFEELDSNHLQHTNMTDSNRSLRDAQSFVAVGSSAHEEGKVRREQRSMKHTIQQQNQSSMECYYKFEEVNKFFTDCSAEAAKAPLTRRGSCDALADVLVTCTKECVAVAPALRSLSLIALTGPARRFFKDNDKPCPAYQVQMVSALKEKINEFVSRINKHASGKLPTSCRELDAVWALGGTLPSQGFKHLMDQVKKKMRLPTRGQIPEMPRECKSAEDEDVHVDVAAGKDNIDVDVAGVFDSYFSCNEFNDATERKLPRKLLLGDEITVKCQDAKRKDYLKRQVFYGGTTDITCRIEHNGNTTRHHRDEGRGMKVILSEKPERRCEACPGGTVAITSTEAVPECCGTKLNPKTGECCKEKKLLGDCR